VGGILLYWVMFFLALVCVWGGIAWFETRKWDIVIFKR
jgi:hypothetical protein